MILVKWGGSVLTNKGQVGPPEVRRAVVRRLARDLRGAVARGPVVLVLGAGSFGHPIALAAGIGKRRLAGVRLASAVTAVQSSVALLRRAVVAELLDAGIAVVEVPGSSLVHSGRVDVEPLLRWARAGFVPLTAGDVVPDKKMGARILSGDEILRVAARAGRPQRAIFVTDVDGVLGAEGLMERLRLKDAKTVLRGVPRGDDATGGMRGKLEAAFAVASQGVPVQIVSAAAGRFRKAALGQRVKGTLVR